MFSSSFSFSFSLLVLSSKCEITAGIGQMGLTTVILCERERGQWGESAEGSQKRQNGKLWSSDTAGVLKGDMAPFHFSFLSFLPDDTRTWVHMLYYFSNALCQNPLFEEEVGGDADPCLVCGVCPEDGRVWAYRLPTKGHWTHHVMSVSCWP